MTVAGAQMLDHCGDVLQIMLPGGDPRTLLRVLDEHFQSSDVLVSQGDIRVTGSGDRSASQPSFIDGFARDVRSLVVTNTRMDVDQGADDAVISFPNTTVADLVEGLNRARVTTRRTIAILQAVKAAGALHADLIVQ